MLLSGLLDESWLSSMMVIVGILNIFSYLAASVQLSINSCTDALVMLVAA
ncbi:hypothetical protein JYQ62_37115 [Nostoc sp. UHCC 0702]|nr:hypothetical protein JYQ62_37115 [Nostoc sp. UHCC 0702]